MKKVRIYSIKRTNGRISQKTGNMLSGNVLINEKHWINGSDWDANIRGAGLPTELPPIAFVGATIGWEELEVTEAMLTAGGGSHKVTSAGREISYEKVGLKVFNVAIDFSTLTVSDSTVNLAKLSLLKASMMPQATPAPVSNQPARPTGGDELLEEEDLDVATTTIPAAPLTAVPPATADAGEPAGIPVVHDKLVEEELPL